MKTKAKITFLIVTMIFFGDAKLYSQCSPATSLPTQGIFPDSFSNATVNMSYSQVIQFLVNRDTTISGAQAVVDSLRILDILGLPQGFSYQCNKPNCMVNGGEIGCALINGTTSQQGLYPFKVPIKVSGKVNVFSTWIAQTKYDTNSTYSILVNSLNGIFEIIDHSQPVKVYPNPAHHKLFIDARSVASLTATVKLFDMKGKLLMTENINVYNNPSIDISSLNPGIYFAEINDGSKIYRAKFITW